MKIYLILISALAAIVFISCKNTEVFPGERISFYFDSPQPNNDSELKEFPSKFRGIYKSGESEALNITENSIYRQSFNTLTLSKSTFDSIKNEVIYKNGKLIIKATSYIYDVAERNDSLYLSAIDRDTIFTLSGAQKAKRINGHVILSTKDSVFWDTSILTIKNDSLYWKSFNTPGDYIALKDIIKNITINKDTTVVHIKPTRKEFKKIFSIPNLGWEKKYKKAK